MKTKVKIMKNNSWDELYTPNESIEMLIPFIPKNIKTIWECTDYGSSNITSVLPCLGGNPK